MARLAASLVPVENDPKRTSQHRSMCYRRGVWEYGIRGCAATAQMNLVPDALINVVGD